MLNKAVVLWIVGLLTIVPYSTYYLFFQASRDEYALLISLVLFWIFGYWSVVGPLLAALKIRRVFRAIQQSPSKGTLMEILRREETRDIAIELIASDNRIPRFLAARVYQRLVDQLGPRETIKTDR